MISTITHKFSRGKVEADGLHLFASICYVNDAEHKTNSQLLRSIIAEYIRTHKNLHPLVIDSNVGCKTIQDYCTELKKGNLSGGTIELQAAAISCRLVIYVISMIKTAYGNSIINILNYGEDVESFKECAYILYDEDSQSYNPLFVINKHNSNDIETIFSRHDQVVLELLKKFIQEAFGDDALLLFDCPNSSCNNAQPVESSDSDGIALIPDLIATNTNTNFPVTRKSQRHADISCGKIVEKHPLLPILDNNDDFDRPAKVAKWDTDSRTVEKLLETDPFSPMCNTQEPPENLLKISNQGHGMTFEVQPDEGFRGRTLGDFLPKDELSEPKPPRYFGDRAGRRYLNLLIPETYLLAGIFRNCLEICIVTREINGYTYIHPYFMFQVGPTDRYAPFLNPIYKFLDDRTSLKPYIDNLRQRWKLELCVIMQKNTALMEMKQPLQVFSSSTINNNEPPITTKYTKHRTFKKAYDLHYLRFVVTLWQKQSGEKVFRRCDNMQYISDISKEDRRHKRTRNNN